MNKSLPRTKGVACFLMIDLRIWMEKKKITTIVVKGREIEFSLRDGVMGDRIQSL
jgi:hypothetical protein